MSASESGDAGDHATRSEDKRLVEIVERATAEMRSGQFIAAEKLAREHPELEADVRELLEALVVTEEVARTGLLSGTRTPGLDRSDPAAEPAGLDSFGDFEIVEEIGRGGMGVVYRAHQHSLDRTVALKVLATGRLATAADAARFRTEARAAASLRHPDIVGVYEVGEIDGRPYFTMPLIEGETLAARLTRGPMEPLEAARLLARVARAVHFAHVGGIYHRDLKPSNIIIDESGAPHVSDFGLARRVESPRTAAEGGLTETGAILGSPSYMAPEQAAGRHGSVDATTDVYGLGAVLYHAVTGRPPARKPTPIDTVLAVLEEDPIPPRTLRPEIPRDLEMVALRCLQKPQDLRYPNADALARDLDAVAAGEPVSAQSGGFIDIIGRTLRPRHHAEVLENWGLLWMLHSVVILSMCLVTDGLHEASIEARTPYVLLWTVGLSTWAAVFWRLRRRGGPITLIERQVAHLWAGGIAASGFLFLVEILLDLRVLALSPVLALISASVFLAKAGMLSGTFYIQAIVLYLTAPLVALLPRGGITLFGLVSAACFSVPGLVYWRRRLRREADGRSPS